MKNEMEIWVGARNFKGGWHNYKTSYAELLKFLFKLPCELDDHCNIEKDGYKFQITTNNIYNSGVTGSREQFIRMALKNALLKAIEKSHQYNLDKCPMEQEVTDLTKVIIEKKKDKLIQQLRDKGF